MPRAEKLTLPDGILRLPIGNHFVSRTKIGRDKNKSN